jgi:hypothetical protein
MTPVDSEFLNGFAAIQAGTPNIPDIFLGKTVVARVSIDAAKQTASHTADILRESRTNIKRLGKAVLGAANAIFLYGDDVALFTAYTSLNNHLPIAGSSKEIISMGIVGTASAGANLYLAKKNQKHFPVNKNVLAKSTKKPEALSMVERIRTKYQTVKKHIGKCGITLSVGVPMTALGSEMSSKELRVHSALYGATAAAIYAGVDIGMEAIDNPFVPAFVAGAVVGNRFISNAVKKAVDGSLYTRNQDQGNDAVSSQSLFARDPIVV